MGDFEDDYDDDYVYMDEDGYMYVEDSCTVADELAEYSVPSPPALDLLDADRYYELDPYDYFMDTEYGTDEYYDVRLAEHHDENKTVGGKRKRDAKSDRAHGKRQKVAPSRHRLTDSKGPPSHPRVVWKSFSELFSLQEPCRQFKGAQAVALLPDWQEKLKDAKGFPAGGTKDIQMETAVNAEEEEDWESDNGESANGEVGIDPETLQSILRERLAETGLAPEALGGILQSLQNGGGDSEALLDQLTKLMLDKAAETGTDSAEGQWLARQGIDLAAEESDGASEAPSAPQQDPAESNADKPPRKAKDEKAEEDAPTTNGHTEAPKEDKAEPQTKAKATRKRKADDNDSGETEDPPKRRARNYAAPTASSKSKTKSTAEPERRSTRSTRGSK